MAFVANRLSIPAVFALTYSPPLSYSPRTYFCSQPRFSKASTSCRFALSHSPGLFLAEWASGKWEQVDHWGRCFGRCILFPGPSLASSCFWLLQKQLSSARPCTMLSLLCFRPKATGGSWPSVETAEAVSPRDSFPFEVVFLRDLITVMGISANGLAVCVGSGWRTYGNYLSLSLTNLASSQPPKSLSLSLNCTLLPASPIKITQGQALRTHTLS